MKLKLITTLILSVLLTCSLNAQEGTWSGNLNVQGMTLPLVFHFSPEGCSMDSPKQGAKGIKTVWTRNENGDVNITVPSIGMSYEGKYDGKVIDGIFRQSGLSIPLTLTQGQTALPKRPQTPVPPFAYTTEEVRFRNGSVELNGTLSLPANYSKDTPVLLMITGSGQQNRDEELFDHKPFAVIADYFARKGIATLRYDDRFYGQPSVRFSDYTTDDFMQDALSGISFLRSRFTHVGILGHSEGGTIALMAAAKGKTDFAISLAGMIVSGKEALLWQNKTLLTNAGFAPDVVNSYCEALSNGFDAILQGRQAGEVAIPATLPDALASNLQAAIRQSAIPYIRHSLTVDVRKSLPMVKCPVLALNGKLDMQVDCEDNLKELEKGLAQSRHRIVAMDGLNHLFQHCKTGAPTEYAEIEETFSPEALEIMTSWMNALHLQH